MESQTANSKKKIAIQRCIKPADFGKVIESSIHHLRLVNNKGVEHCLLLIGKASASPLKYASMPRLKLVAAILSVKIALLLRDGLNIEINKKYLWTNSKVVLVYQQFN